MLLLYLFFLIVMVSLVGAAVYVRGAGTGKNSFAGPMIVLSIGGAEALISCYVYLRLYYYDMGIFAYMIFSAVLLAAVWVLVEKLLKSYLLAEGGFKVVRTAVAAMTVFILLSCPACVGVTYMLDRSYPGADGVARYSDDASEEASEAVGLAMQTDSVSGYDGAFYDEVPEFDDAADAGTDDGEAFAPGISDWSGGKCYFAGSCGFRNVDFFINDGDRCIEVMVSPTDMLNMYAYVGTSDGWHCFRKYERIYETVRKMEMKDLFGNPMTINVPVIIGPDTKYEKGYLDSYVFIAEDASEFVDGDESFPAVDQEGFWNAWNGVYGKEWYRVLGGGGPSASFQGAEGSISDYSVGKCKYCGGTGKCSKCGGTGYVDFMGDIQRCPSCRGFGRCFNCGGSGLQL